MLLNLQERIVKNVILIFALSVFAFTVPGFANENSKSESSSEISAHQHGGSGHGGHGGHSGHGGHGHSSRSHAHSYARGHYHHGRFDHGYFNSHFGPGYPIFWGGVYWGFGPGFVFLPQWQVAGWYVASIATGYVLLNPAFPTVQVPVVVNINLAPPADEDDADESDE
jgi:hypothetical protein